MGKKDADWLIVKDLANKHRGFKSSGLKHVLEIYRNICICIYMYEYIYIYIYIYIYTYAKKG